MPVPDSCAFRFIEGSDGRSGRPSLQACSLVISIRRVWSARCHAGSGRRLTGLWLQVWAAPSRRYFDYVQRVMSVILLAAESQHSLASHEQATLAQRPSLCSSLTWPPSQPRIAPPGPSPVSATLCKRLDRRRSPVSRVKHDDALPAAVLETHGKVLLPRAPTTRWG